MKIVFICGSLESGKDGVGDYTRRLAAELQRRGHCVWLVALNDRHLSPSSSRAAQTASIRHCFFEHPQEASAEPNVICETQTTDGITVKVLRISTKLKWTERRHVLDTALTHIAPTHLSLQFVPYAYSTKGIPLSLLRYLRQLNGAFDTQVMLHELWIGYHSNCQVRKRLTALVQKYIVQALLKTLRPTAIHTNLPEYSEKIKRLGFACHGLPIFSNLGESNEPLDSHTANDMSIRVGLFSQLDITAPVAAFLQKLLKEAADAGCAMSVTLIGGSPHASATAKCRLLEALGADMCVIETGFLSSTQAQAAIHRCTLGLSPVPRHAAGKSGSIAAFIAAGVPVALPVVLTGKDPSDIGFFHDGLRHACMTEAALNAIPHASAAALKHRNEISVAQVAENFLNDLK